MILTREFWHKLFETGVALKAFNSAWEIIGGFFIMASIRGWFPHLFTVIGKLQSLGDRDDMFSHLFFSHITNLSMSSRSFVSIYLLFHGFMNMFLAYNLFKNHMWAYPVSMVFTSTFLVYQFYRLSHTHSLFLLVVSLFDLAYIFLTWHEYHYQHTRKHNHAATS